MMYREYAHIMGQLAGKPSERKMPSFMMKLFMGETSDMVLHNRRMVPQRVLASGYKFRFSRAQDALEDLFQQVPA